MPATATRLKPILRESITALAILLFAYTGISKLISHSTFYHQIKAVPIISQFATIISWSIPITEIIIALALLFKQSRIPGWYAFTALMIIFTIYIAVILGSNNPLPCSCGGIIQLLSWQQHLLLNLVFISLGVLAIMIHPKRVGVK